MEKSQMLWIASKYASKGYNFDQLKYGDDLYGKEDLADDIWNYVEEYQAMGSIAFRDKYKEYKLY